MNMNTHSTAGTRGEHGSARPVPQLVFTGRAFASLGTETEAEQPPLEQT